MNSFGFAVEIGENDRNVAAEFPDDLAASSAWRSQFLSIHDNGDPAEFRNAAGDALPNRDTLRTDGQAVACRFNIAASIDVAVLRLDGRTDLEVRIRSESPFANIRRRIDQFLFRMFHFSLMLLPVDSVSLGSCRKGTPP